MEGYEASRGLVFSGTDHGKPRMLVEQEKLRNSFPSFGLYGKDGEVTSVSGELTTNYDNTYRIRISVGSSYPYMLPEITLVDHTLPFGCPHKFRRNRICVMRAEQWHPSLSLAFLVSKAAIWLNKYDLWRASGRGAWPGNEQPH